MAWLIVQTVKLTSIIHRMPVLRMNGSMYLFPLYAFMEWNTLFSMKSEQQPDIDSYGEWGQSVLGYCYVVTPCIFQGYIERIWEIFFCCPHRTAVVMFVLYKKNCSVTRGEMKVAWQCQFATIHEFTQQISAEKNKAI